MKTPADIRWKALALCCAAALWSCSGEHAMPEEEEAAITFSTPHNWGDTTAGTRLTSFSETPSFETGDRIGVFACYTPEGGTDEVQLMLNEEVEYTSSSSWYYDPVKYWPTSGTMTFYAYYPYDENATSTEAISFDNVLKDDIMWADPKTYDITADGTPASVELTFNHALAAIEVNVACSEGMDVLISSLKLLDSKSGIMTQGTLDITTDPDISGAFTPAGTPVSAVDFEITPPTALTPAPQTFGRFIPEYQGIEEGQMELAFVFVLDGVEEEASFTLPSTKEEEPRYPYSYDYGKRYIYNLVLNEDKSVSIMSIIIDNFEDDGNWISVNIGKE